MRGGGHTGGELVGMSTTGESAGIRADILFKSVASGKSITLLIDTASNMGLAWKSNIAERSDGELALGFFDIQVFQVPVQHISVLVNLPIDFEDPPEPPKQNNLI